MAGTRHARIVGLRGVGIRGLCPAAAGSSDVGGAHRRRQPRRRRGQQRADVVHRRRAAVGRAGAAASRMGTDPVARAGAAGGAGTAASADRIPVAGTGAGGTAWSGFRDPDGVRGQRYRGPDPAGAARTGHRRLRAGHCGTAVRADPAGAMAGRERRLSAGVRAVGGPVAGASAGFCPPGTRPGPPGSCRSAPRDQRPGRPDRRAGGDHRGRRRHLDLRPATGRRGDRIRRAVGPDRDSRVGEVVDRRLCRSGPARQDSSPRCWESARRAWR